jgi:hypothetical protein
MEAVLKTVCNACEEEKRQLREALLQRFICEATSEEEKQRLRELVLNGRKS